MPRKARRSTWGCVEVVIKNKKHRIRYKADTGDGRGYRTHSETMWGTYSEAEQRKAELRALYGNQRRGPRRGPAPTVRAVHDELWWPKVRGKIKPNTFKNYDSVWRNHIEPRMGSTACTSVGKDDVEALIAECPASQARVIRNVLGGIFNVAFDKGYVSRNPASGRMDSMPDQEASDRRVWSLAQIDAAWEALRGSVAELPFILQAAAGCRVGESLGIKVGEIAYSERDGVLVASARILRQVNDSGAVLDWTKNKSSTRQIAVGEPWSARIRELEGEARTRGDVWLVDRGDGRPVPQHRVRYQYKAALRRAGIDPIPLRNLRPSYETSSNWELGEDISRIGKMMGHASGSSVTFRVYDRPGGDAVSEMASRMSKRRGGGCAQL